MNRNHFIVATVILTAIVTACKKNSPEDALTSVTTQAPAAPTENLDATKAKAEAGDLTAQTRLGFAYEKGIDIKADMKAAASWFQRAADQGYPDALAALGELTQAGQGVPRDAAKAAELFRQAAEKGSVAGQYNLGYLYEQGLGVARDDAEAAKWYKLAAEGGDALAQFDLGQRYHLGIGVRADDCEACKWLSLAVQNGQADAGVLLDKVKQNLTRIQLVQIDDSVRDFKLRQLPGTNYQAR